MYNIKFAILIIFKLQFSSAKCIHIVVQTIFRTLFKTETLSPFNNLPPPPSPRNHCPTSLLCVLLILETSYK